MMGNFCPFVKAACNGSCKFQMDDGSCLIVTKLANNITTSNEQIDVLKKIANLMEEK